ncbi:MAG TPA: M24 family metallopeptidase [Acidobacteriota bacterium]|nr:M24 family metallopeptidase [Acidobacteriota bacterium]
MDEWLELRLDRLIPELMRREGIDMWVLIAREYNEDPVLKTMLPATWFSARRRTILLFHDREEGGVERLAVSRYDIGRFFESAWDVDAQPDQWTRLTEIIEERNPAAIAVNFSDPFALADGISRTEFESLRNALPEPLRDRIVSGERLAIGWLETRIPEEMAVYPLINRIAHRIIEEGFSEAAVQPGVTTTSQLQWWFRERIRQLGLKTWFHPSVSLQRATGVQHEGDFSARPDDAVIQPGDLLHVDFGITYLGLNTDTQRHAYVLKTGETEAPQGLRVALAQGNRLQDILTSNFRAGGTGNEILAAALEQAENEGIRPSIYTHPIGAHGHGAGPTIGLWDQQDGVPGAGDYPLFPSTAHSIELNVTVSIPEWNDQEVRIMLEEDAFFDGNEIRYIDGRQTELYLIPRVAR